MARNALRIPRHIPKQKIIAIQPDLLGAPDVSYEARKRSYSPANQARTLKYHLATQLGDIEQDQ